MRESWDKSRAGNKSNVPFRCRLNFFLGYLVEGEEVLSGYHD